MRIIAWSLLIAALVILLFTVLLLKFATESQLQLNGEEVKLLAFLTL